MKTQQNNNFSVVASAALMIGGLAVLGGIAWGLLRTPASPENFQFPETKFGAYLANRHAIWVDDFESVMKFTESLKDSDVISVKQDAAMGRFLAGQVDDTAKVLAGDKGMLARAAYIAYLLKQDNWKEIYKMTSADKSQVMAPLRIWSAVATGKESEAIKFIDSLHFAESWKLFTKGMIYAETNRPDKAKAAFDKVPLDFINLNDYLYLKAFYKKHGFDEAAEELRSDFASTPGGAFINNMDLGADKNYFGHRKALGFGLIQNVSHTPAMSYSNTGLVLLRLAQAAINEDDDAINYYLGMFFYNVESPAYTEYFEKIKKDSPYSLFVMLKNAEKAGNFKKMRSELKSALKKNPTFMPALTKLVGINLQKGRENDALKIVNNALKQAELSDSIRSYLLCLRARIYTAKGNLNRAEDDILKAGDLTPTNPDVLIETAKIWVAKKENLDQAYLYAAAVIKDSPSDLDGWDTLAMIVWAKEGAEEASDILERVGRVAGENSSLFQHLGDVRAELGNKKGARDAYERALEYSSDGLSCGEKCLKKKIKRLK